MLMAKLGGSGGGKSAGPDSDSLHFAPAKAVISQRICYGYTQAQNSWKAIISFRGSD